MLKVINFMLFQGGWLLTVYGAGSGYPWVGPAFTLVWVCVHLGLFKPRRRPELGLLIFSGLFGYICDSILVVSGMIQFPLSSQLGAPSTLWMVALWVNLGMTLNYSLAWLGGYQKWAIVFGFAGGMLAYFAGGKLAALTLLQGTTSLLMIGIIWAIAMPVLFLGSRYLYAHDASLQTGQTGQAGQVRQP